MEARGLGGQHWVCGTAHLDVVLKERPLNFQLIHLLFSFQGTQKVRCSRMGTWWLISQAF